LLLPDSLTFQRNGPRAPRDGTMLWKFAAVIGKGGQMRFCLPRLLRSFRPGSGDDSKLEPGKWIGENHSTYRRARSRMKLLAVHQGGNSKVCAGLLASGLAIETSSQKPTALAKERSSCLVPVCGGCAARRMSMAQIAALEQEAQTRKTLSVSAWLFDVSVWVGLAFSSIPPSGGEA